MLMIKGNNHIGFVSKARARGLATPTRVPSATSLHGQALKASSTKTSNAGGFAASRRKGTVRGSHVA